MVAMFQGLLLVMRHVVTNFQIFYFCVYRFGDGGQEQYLVKPGLLV